MFETDRPFTTAQALQAGRTRRWLAGPEVESILHGVHVVSPVRDRPAVRARSALLTHPAGAVASRSTAARLLGVPVPRDPAEHVTVSREADRRRRLGVRCHVAQLRDDDIQVLRGVRVTSPHRLFVDLAETLPLVDLVVAGDWLVRNGWVTVASLTDYCRTVTAPHAAGARRAAAFVRAGVDSPMETRLRMLLVLAGLPEPVVNAEVHDDMGLVRMRLDLSYPGVRVAVEYDGRHHLTSTAQWERDVERRNNLSGGGWLLITVTSSGIYRNPEETVERVWRALKDRGFQGLRRPSAAWRAHFPG